MKTCVRSVLQLIVVGVALGAIGQAATTTTEDASLYLVHGIPGRDVSATLNPQFPVDVFVNDSVCYLKGFTFGSSSGPLELPAGSYDIKISMANSLAPCTNPPIVESEVKLGAGGTTTAVAALSSGSPALLTFVDNLKTVKTGESRFTLANAADAGALTVTLTQEFVKNPVKRTITIKPGDQTSIDLPLGTYSVQAEASAGGTPLVSTAVFGGNQAADLMYFVGSATNGSLSLVQRSIQDVF
jgi:Domain of unknown function (DUF4397)